MNYDHIIQSGYGKLAEMLPDTDKEFMNGFSYAIEMIERFKGNIYDDNDNTKVEEV